MSATAASAAVQTSASPRKLLLQLRGVETFYGKIQALKGVDIDVNEGEIVTLIGANGAGKSTTMMTIFGSPRAPQGHDHLRRAEHHQPAAPHHRAHVDRAIARRAAASFRA